MSNEQPVATLLAQALQQLLDMATGGQDQPAITLPPAAQPTAPTLLAQEAAVQPAKGRRQPQADNLQLYTRCLALYRERMAGDSGQDDLGRAAALFVMANLAVLGRTGDATTLQAVTQQMQNALQQLPHWPGTGLAARQMLFEQLATLSVLVTQSAERARGQGPLARANVRTAALAYLRQWLALDAEFLTLSPQGLVVSPQAVLRRTKKVLAA